MQPRIRRRLRRATAVTLATAIVFVLLANRWVINSTDSYLYRDSALMPENEVGLVLGTSSYTRGGAANPQFHGRIEAAARLYHQGKIKRLILSGANPDARYNEPRRMQEALVEKGVPPEALMLDFAGDRTFESVIRSREVSGLSRVTIITQKYHAYRALFLARKIGMQAVAYAAPMQDGGEGFRHPPREIFARVLAVFDLYLRYGEQPQPEPASRTNG